MEHFRTEIRIPNPDFKLNHYHSFFCIGSCFSEHIHSRLQASYFKSYSNPGGIVYNPVSIRNQLKQLIKNQDWSEDDLIQYKGLFHGLHHHGIFSNIHKEQALASMNAASIEARKYLQSCDCILLTFGTATTYTLIDKKIVVANCHKIPSDRFNTRMLEVEEIVETTGHWIHALLAINPTVKIITTISPVRYAKKGFIDNTRSKARLALALEHLGALFTQVDYFPAYEILLDDLRDYRFYKEDMIHPNEQAIDYIWHHFKQTYFDRETIDLMEKLKKIRQGLSHRPIHPEGTEHEIFKEQLKQSMDDIKSKYPFIEFD